MNIQTVQFPHILETRDLTALNDFLSHTAFIVSHKSESVETLLRVLWYIPVNSTIIIVTNCQEHALGELADALKTRLTDHQQTYLIHQKDPQVARLFKTVGVPQILGKDGRVRNGKGEGMYIGTLAAQQLDYLRWVIFYDADNFVPSALLEYTFAMCRLFKSAPSSPLPHPQPQTPNLHNVRICWSSKPDMKNLNLDARILGRTSKVVSPIFDDLLAGWFGKQEHPIYSSNAGEQGMTLKTATTLRFSSGFSVETFHLLDLLFHAVTARDEAGEVVFQQYLSKSPHFHEKKGERHIKKMIEESLGCFFHFEETLPATVKEHLQQVYQEMQLEHSVPLVYPALQDLPLVQTGFSSSAYALFPHEPPVNQAVLEINPADLMTGDLSYSPLLLADVTHQSLIRAETPQQNLLTIDVSSSNLLIPEVNPQNVLTSDIMMAD